MRGCIWFLLMSAAAADLPQSTRSEIVERIEVNGGADLLLRDREFRLYRCFANQEILGTPPVRAGDVVEWTLGFDAVGKCKVAALRYIGRPSDMPGRTRLRLDLNPLNSLIRRGNLSYGGIVTRLDAQTLALRTARGERLDIVLREDTHFFHAGVRTKRDDLALHQTVSIRAGRTFDGQLEAFYVMWGDILRPGVDSLKPH